MKLNNATRASHLVQPIDVLRDDVLDHVLALEFHSAVWPKFGFALKASSILHLYYSHTSLGFLAKASGVASSFGLYLDHR